MNHGILGMHGNEGTISKLFPGEIPWTEPPAQVPLYVYSVLRGCTLPTRTLTTTDEPLAEQAEPPRATAQSTWDWPLQGLGENPRAIDRKFVAFSTNTEKVAHGFRGMDEQFE